MASNKTGMRAAKGSVKKGLGNALIRIVAVGVAGGTVLIGSAKKLGEAIERKQSDDQKKLEARREADREEVRRITEVESGNEY